MSGLTPLSYLIMKTERAKVHLDALNRELDIFAKEPYTVIAKEDVENSRYIRRYKMKPLEPIIGMLLGEFLYCLRSGLDQMAWQLALPDARMDPKLAKLICFPIVGEIRNSQDRRNLEKVMDSFPSDVADEIDSFQPYKRGSLFETDSLWQLNSLCNIDKHCIVPINSRSMNVFVPRNPAAKVTDPLDDEDAVDVSVPLCDKHQFDFEPEPCFPIEFGEWNSDLRIPRERLTDIYDFIECRVFPKFAKFAAMKVAFVPRLRVEMIKPVYR